MALTFDCLLSDRKRIIWVRVSAMRAANLQQRHPLTVWHTHDHNQRRLTRIARLAKGVPLSTCTALSAAKTSSYSKKQKPFDREALNTNIKRY